jgi:hypothetical protein
VKGALHGQVAEEVAIEVEESRGVRLDRHRTHRVDPSGFRGLSKQERCYGVLDLRSELMVVGPLAAFESAVEEGAEVRVSRVLGGLFCV